MANNDDDTTKELKNLISDFVYSLGLIEIILGSAVAYCIWLTRKEELVSVFPSTGISFIDIGLMIFAAALFGKLLTIMVAVVFEAIFSLIIMKTNAFGLGYRDNLQNALCSYYDIPNNTDTSTSTNRISAIKTATSLKRPDLIELAMGQIGLVDSNKRVYFERLDANVTTAYGAVLLATIYYFYLSSKQSALSSYSFFAIIIFFILGVITQFVLIKNLGESLVAINKKKAGT